MTQAELVLTKSVTVNAPVEKAFRVFTEGIATWWPLRTHSVSEDDAETVAFESGVGGRLYERDSSGGEHQWGRVLAWEPPDRIVYSWYPAREPETGQEVEVRFSESGEGTLVQVEQRGWERLGERAAAALENYDSESGWTGVLARYVAAAES